MKQNKYGAWAIGAWMLLLTVVSCTDSYEGTPVNMFTEDYLFSRLIPTVLLPVNFSIASIGICVTDITV